MWSWKAWLPPVLVVIFGVVDKVVGQIQAKTLGQYNFMKTAMNCILYFVVYYTVLLGRVQGGAVPSHQLHFMYACKLEPSKPGLWQKLGAWKLLLVAGACDCLNEFMSFAAQPYVKGLVAALLSQLTAIFAVAWSLVLLRARYTVSQCAGILLCILGATCAAWGSDWSTSSPGHAILYAASAAPSALSFVLKEMAFREYTSWNSDRQFARALSAGEPTQARLSEPEALDVFVVCSAAGLFQLLAAPVILPVSSNLENVDNVPLGDWWLDAWQCFVNSRPDRLAPDVASSMPCICSNAWQLYALYAIANAGLNISIYYSILYSSTVFLFLTMKIIAPVSAFVFLIDWPIIGSSSMSIAQLGSLVITFTGLMLFRFAASVRAPLREQFDERFLQERPTVSLTDPRHRSA